MLCKNAFFFLNKHTQTSKMIIGNFAELLLKYSLHLLMFMENNKIHPCINLT